MAKISSIIYLKKGNAANELKLQIQICRIMAPMYQSTTSRDISARSEMSSAK